MVLSDEQLVKWFLEHGAQIDPPPPPPELDWGNSLTTTSAVCLNIAASISSTVVFDLLLEYGVVMETSTPLHSAAGTGMDDERIPMMAYLIEAGYDVNATDETREFIRLGRPYITLSGLSLLRRWNISYKGARILISQLDWLGPPLKWRSVWGWSHSLGS